MCLGVPGLVVERETESEFPTGLVEFAGLRRRVSLACVPEAKPGDYVIVHAGIAISVIDPAEAERLFEFIDQSDEADDWRLGSGTKGATDEIR